MQNEISPEEGCNRLYDILKNSQSKEKDTISVLALFTNE